MKLDLGAFEGYSDQWIFMIFGCAILHYFTVVFVFFYFTATASITFERRRKNQSRGGFRVARNCQMVATTRFQKNVIKPV